MAEHGYHVARLDWKKGKFSNASPSWCLVQGTVPADLAKGGWLQNSASGDLVARRAMMEMDKLQVEATLLSSEVDPKF